MEAAVRKFFKIFTKALSSSDIFDGAASLSFYLLLSIFPAFIVLFTLVSYIPMESLNEQILSWTTGHFPDGAASLFTKIIEDVASQDRGGIISLGVVMALWAATTGMEAIIRQLNAAHDLSETRGFIRIRLVSLGLISSIGFLIVLSFTLIIIWSNLVESFFPKLLQDSTLYFVITLIRYIILAVALMLIFASIYYLGPNKKLAFKNIVPGSIFAAFGFLLASWGFSVYVDNFGKFSALYGGLGAAIVLMVWFYLLGMLIVMGAQINEAYRKLLTGINTHEH